MLCCQAPWRSRVVHDCTVQPNEACTGTQKTASGVSIALQWSWCWRWCGKSLPVVSNSEESMSEVNPICLTCSTTDVHERILSRARVFWEKSHSRALINPKFALAGNLIAFLSQTLHAWIFAYVHCGWFQASLKLSCY